MPQRADQVRHPEYAPTEIEEPLPLTVVPDWVEQLRKANSMMRLIDRHLDYEERGRRMLANERLMPIGLCPEQRVNMVTDILAVSR